MYIDDICIYVCILVQTGEIFHSFTALYGNIKTIFGYYGYESYDCERQ